VYLRDLSPLSPEYQGRTVRIAVRDTAENARIVAACQAALEELRAGATPLVETARPVPAAGSTR
jgi:hypothetical protein